MSDSSNGWSKMLGRRTDFWLRTLLLVYVVLVASPMRFWTIRNDDIDYTFVFALNYGAAHGLLFGRDLVFQFGPLGFLTFPQNIGHNLVYALVFQACSWAVLAAIFTDLFFRTGIPLRNLFLFALGIGLASPVFWFDRIPETLFLAGAMALLIVVRFQGGVIRYVTALAMIGLGPLIKVSAAVQGGAALGGFLIDLIIRKRWKAWREVALAATVPLAVFAGGLWLTIPSLDGLQKYLRGSWELMSGYSDAVSKSGPMVEVVAALVTLVAIGLLLYLPANPALTRFFILFLGPPLLVALKHGFTVHDAQVVNFFCFVALILGLAALYADFTGWRRFTAVAVMVSMPMICLPYLVSYKNLFADISGLRAVRAMWLAYRSAMGGGGLAQEKALLGNMAPGPLVDPEIRAIVKDSTIASLSENYSAAYFDGLNLQIYPVIQRYNAYTRYLDNLNSEWICTKGPQFLVFDGGTPSNQHTWTETPAMWAEIYRNYQTRLLTKTNLLLERRGEPRFKRFEEVKRFQVPMPGELDLPAADQAVFWSLKCDMTSTGSLRKMLFRMPEVTLTVETDDGHRKEFRTVVGMLTAPVMGAWLPDGLPDYAAVLKDAPDPNFRVKKLIFGGPGASFYQSSCEGRWLRPVK